MIDLDELERLHEAATPGLAVAVADGPYYVAVCHDAPADPPGLVVGDLRPADGALYVAARNALPELLRLVRRAQCIDALRAQLAEREAELAAIKSSERERLIRDACGAWDGGSTIADQMNRLSAHERARRAKEKP